jgi:hypothetical protein
VESCCEFGIKPSGSVKCWETIEWPNICVVECDVYSDKTFYQRTPPPPQKDRNLRVSVPVLLAECHVVSFDRQKTNMSLYISKEHNYSALLAIPQLERGLVTFKATEGGGGGRKKRASYKRREKMEQS